MNVEKIMSGNPITCMPDTSLQQAARWMVEGDCGALPVVDIDNKPLGVITDRDITCRIIAQGKDPYALHVEDAMTHSAATVFKDTPLEDCMELMEENQVRRMIVLDDDGTVCGMVSQADLARHLPPDEAAELVREVSWSSSTPSQVH
ncbi:CBS domain-containing protein [Pyxidicoccus fallax]|uniref:CBS domain-containing protein n=1 Tax=Pyxidicoccus fallax TaxID=394095 RepID=A0A848LAJ0_9BACT|nr:CBS domain-containing protein [Pyxidicoccus fallax]NMO15272.1 CBS domain-containing protein [Pyxidicoccus fallax]NPC77615.1 CBS domain-containing protein [Pyxidicoccus fallax]